VARLAKTGALAAAIVTVCLAPPAHAQLGDILNKIIPPALRTSEPTPGTATATGAGGAAAPLAASTTTAVAGDAPPVGPRAGVEAELKPDTQCNRPQEKFNVAEKLADYGGQNAVLRLRRLVQTDFKYSDLTPQDKQMLEYIAKTTVWVPAEVESKLAAIFTGGFSIFGGPRLNELDKAAMALIEQRLNMLKATVTDFPAEIKLTLNKDLPDGAFAKFGGVILLSERFLGGMTEKPEAGDFVLAHELSHVYKRHAIKQLQFQLLSTSEGWEIARKVLDRAQRGAAVDPVGDATFAFTVVPQLVDFVRSMQLKFNRDQELEADACSVVWMNAAGMSPLAAWAAYRATVMASGEPPAGSYEASHPTTRDREARFAVKAGGAGAKPRAPAAPVGRPAAPARKASAPARS